MEQPLIIIIPLVGAVIGALLMAYTFSRMGQRPSLGALLGAGGGAAGALLFMIPLNFCMFEAERKSIDFVFGIALIAIGMAIVLGPIAWFVNQRTEKSIATKDNAHQPQGMFKGWLIPAILLAPTLIVLALFLYYPTLDNFRLATLLTRLGAPRTRFVCVDNFTSLATDPSYIQSILTTFAISFAIIVLGLTIALFIAMMAYQPIRGARIYRTLLVWPYSLSPAVVGVIFLLMFSPIAGVINYVIESLFGFKVPWLNDPTYAPWTVILAAVWNHLGFNILFYIAGLQNVPTDLQESAAIDGANAWQRFRHVIFPLLSPITFFLVITNLTYSFFDIFATIDMLTRGGPVNSTTTLIYRIFQTGVQERDLGKAAAQSIVLLVMVIGITVLQFRTTGRRVNYGA
jgi:sn-glycerol 3-phosphate transport system permease protein